MMALRAHMDVCKSTFVQVIILSLRRQQCRRQIHASTSLHSLHRYVCLYATSSWV